MFEVFLKKSSHVCEAMYKAVFYKTTDHIVQRMLAHFQCSKFYQFELEQRSVGFLQSSSVCSIVLLRVRF